MNSNKKPIFKPVVAQLKTAAKTARPVAPPVYRPQPLPKVLQRKSAVGQSPQSGQTPRQPVAPPVYRPEVKTVQPKMISPARKLPTTPPVFRPGHKPTVPAAVVSNRPPAVAQAKASPLRPPIPMTRSHSVVQRAAKKAEPYTMDLDEEGLLPQESEELCDMAKKFNMASRPDGKLESRHTQAVTLDEDMRIMMFTQRWLAPMGEVGLPDPIEMKDEDYVIGDQRDDENIHAEMLAISWYLQGKAKLPQHMGVSKPVCARCSVVLQYFDIAHFSDGTKTKNWTSPWRHANQHPPIALKGRIPEIVRRSKEYPYKEKDWQ